MEPVRIQTAGWARALGVWLGAAWLACAWPAHAAGPFGYIFREFSLGATGYDTAGGITADQNFFLTTSNIEVRDALGSLTSTIALPGGVAPYGLAYDGTDLFVSNTFGHSIYRYVGEDLWTGGLGISERGARGLAASETDFFLVVDDGANIARLSKTGTTLNKYDILSIVDPLDGGYGLDWIPQTHELLTTDGTSNIYRLKLKPDYSAIDSYELVPTSGLGSSNLRGIGYNSATGNLILNENNIKGQYAYGLAVPEPATVWLTVAGGGALLSARARRKR